MHQDVVEAGGQDKLSQAFEHSITWEDDIWRADPVDVPEVHVKARRKFADLSVLEVADDAQRKCPSEHDSSVF